MLGLRIQVDANFCARRFNAQAPTTVNDNSKASFIPAMSGIAREAGALLLEYFHEGLKIEYKGEADLVTKADGSRPAA